jgi:hypothetical protein
MGDEAARAISCTVARARLIVLRCVKKGDPVREDKSMDGDRFVSMMRELVLPSIRQKLKDVPVVKIQFDNAPGHKTRVADGNQTIEEALARSLAAPKYRGRQVGPKIEIVEQIANSPDTNACDLGFFRSLDSRLPRNRSMKLDSFEQEVLTAYQEYPPEKLAAIFDHKKRICKAIIGDGGNNTYKMPHARDQQ